jgi:hypothetical protein
MPANNICPRDSHPYPLELMCLTKKVMRHDKISLHFFHCIFVHSNYAPLRTLKANLSFFKTTFTVLDCLLLLQHFKDPARRENDKIEEKSRFFP